LTTTSTTTTKTVNVSISSTSALASSSPVTQQVEELSSNCKFLPFYSDIQSFKRQVRIYSGSGTNVARARRASG